MYSYGFIGCGNMGGTLAVSVAKTTKDIALSSHTKETALNLANKIGAVATTNLDIASNSRFVVLGVKPQVLPEVLKEIAPALRRDDCVVISMAAGVTIASIVEQVGYDIPMIRIMPNTPARIGEGMMIYSVSANVTDDIKNEFERAFKESGDIIEIPEDLIDAGCAVSGCGPAFAYMFVASLAKGGVECGLSEELALKLAAKTVAGAADTILKTKEDPEALKDAVCSPGGSTIQGVNSLEADDFRKISAKAVQVAFKRTKELGKK